jgi:glycosyltransferase involved in cell wall biosynthesis
MTVSIALCTYNGERFIREQIESYLNQTILPDEIIVCDDHSGDNTLQLIRQYTAGQTAIRWQIIQNEHRLGTNRNFEKAIGLCTGDLIMFSDQDDIWTESKIENTLSFFERNPNCGATFSNGLLIDDRSRVLPETLLDHCFFTSDIRKQYTKDDLLYWSILLGNIMTGATMVVRRTVLPTILPLNLNLGRQLWYDGWVGFCLMCSGQVGYIDQSLIKYRIHPGQQVGVSSGNDPFEQFIMRGNYRATLVKEYFQRYLMAFSFMQHLKKIVRIPSHITDRITSEYLTQRKKYFESQGFFERKLRLLKWHIQGANYISFRDLMTL